MAGPRMTAEIYKIRDYQKAKPIPENTKDWTYEPSTSTWKLNEAVEIANVALVGDTAPSEYTAPDKDSA
jgi:hypothetical protein